jgi:hypothetical protein
VVGVDQVDVAGVAVADDGAGVAGQHLPGVDVGLGPAAGVHRGQKLGGRDVDVFESAVGAGGGFVDVQHPDCAQQFADAGQEADLQQPGGAGSDTGHEPG